MRMSCLLMMAAGAGFLSIPASSESISDARAALAQFREEVQAAQSSAIGNDPKGSGEHANKAEECLRNARKLFEDSDAGGSSEVEVLLEYAEVLMAMTDYDLAAGVMERATQLQPENATPWVVLGEALSRNSGDSKRAVSALRKAAELGQPSEAARAQVALAQVYRRAGLHDLARDSFQRATELDPANVAAKVGLALDMVRQGNVLEGGRALDSLQNIPPDIATGLSQSIAEALFGFAQSKRCFPDTAENHLEYAKLLVRCGRVSEALDATERSLELDSGNYTAWNLVGGIRRGLGDVDGARTAYEKSLQIKPEQPHTQEMLQSLTPTPAPVPPS